MSRVPRQVACTVLRGGRRGNPPALPDRVDAETGVRKRFASAILPPWARKTPKISEVLPLLYLHGLSSGDFVPALGQFLGSSAGLSPRTVTKLTEQWQDEQRAFAKRELSGVDYVYLWVDGIHVNIRLEEHKLCLLVMIGGACQVFGSGPLSVVTVRVGSVGHSVLCEGDPGATLINF